MRIFHYLSGLLLCFALAACVELTPAGTRVQVLDSQQASLSHCHYLGPVSVSNDDALRNAAAELAGDTAVREMRELGGAHIIRGLVYRCEQANSRSYPQTVEVASPAPQPAITELPASSSSATDESMSKTEKCQLKGGRWTGEWCVIDLD